MKDQRQFSRYLNFRQAITFSGLNYAQSFISFLVSFILARHLGTEGYGQYAYGLVFANTLMVLMQFGTDKTLVRDLVQVNAPEAVLFAAIMLWSLAGLIGVVGITLWSFLFSEMSRLSTWVVFLCALSGSIQGMSISAWFDYNGKMSLQAVYGLIGRLLFLIGALWVIFAIHDESITVWIAGALLASRIVSLVLEWTYLKKSAVFLYREASSFLRLLVRNNQWVWWAAIGNLLMTQANQIILKDQGGTTQLAYYGLAFQVIMLVRLLQQQIMRLTAPSIADITDIRTATSEKILYSLRRYCLASFLASVCLLVPLYAVTPWIIRTFVGANYMPAIPVMNTLYIWSALYGVALINNQFLIGLRKEKAFFKITLAFGIFSIFLAYIFVGKFKAQGAAMSLLLAHFGSVAYQFIIVLRTTKSRLND